MNCEQASSTVFQDNQGRSWEQFNLSNQSVFLNQIPNAESYTRTDPGWVLNDYGYCNWQGVPPLRMRTEMPVIQPASLASVPGAETEANPGSVMGFMMLIALGSSAAYTWWKHKQQDEFYKEPYDPHKHIPTALPFSLSGNAKKQSQDLPDELIIDADEPVPEGYAVVEEFEEEDVEEEDIVTPGKMSGVTEPSPWLRDQLPPLHLQPPGLTQVEPLTNQVVQPSEPPSYEPLNHLRTTSEPSTEPARTSFEPACEPPTEPVRFEVVQGGLDGSELHDRRCQLLLEKAPYDLYDDQFKTICFMKTAIDLGFSKNRTMKLFVHSKAVLNGLIETTELSKGDNSAYVYFSELFSEAKRAV